MQNIDIKIYTKQIQDCINIFASTTSAEVFFSRYQLLMTRLDELIKINPSCKINFYTASELKQKNIDEKQTMIHLLINHGQEKLSEKLETLKTVNSKQTAIDKFCKSFDPYIDQLDDWNKKYLSRIAETKVE